MPERLPGALLELVSHGLANHEIGDRQEHEREDDSGQEEEQDCVKVHTGRRHGILPSLNDIEIS